MARNRFEVLLRYGVNKGHEYRFARVRRENAAIKERDAMVAMTVENMREHCKGGRVVQGAHPTDPNAVMVASLYPDGRTIWKTVTFESINRDEDDGLEDALLASLVAVQAGAL